MCREWEKLDKDCCAIHGEGHCAHNLKQVWGPVCYKNQGFPKAAYKYVCLKTHIRQEIIDSHDPSKCGFGKCCLKEDDAKCSDNY